MSHTLRHCKVPLTPSRILPPDPFTYVVPDSNQYIVFDKYVRLNSRISTQRDINAVLLQAANAVVAQLSTSGDEPIEAAILDFEVGRVHLTLYPDLLMTWCGLLFLQNFITFQEKRNGKKR